MNPAVHRASAPEAAPSAQADAWPHSVLVVGCGLLGASLGLALRQFQPALDLMGIEPIFAHRQVVLEQGAFTDVHADLSELTRANFDLCILAAPLSASCALLSAAAASADVVMDICSAKEGICEAALRAGLGERFVPSHPMAGLASPGPADARADLFRDRPWILLDGWPATERAQALIRALGGRPVTMQSAVDHDRAMAAVSHGVHLASLSTLLAYASAEAGASAQWAGLTGPGFRDVTRLAASPTEFWADTLLANATEVTAQVERIRDYLQSFKTALECGNRAVLTQLLDAARAAHQSWKS